MNFRTKSDQETKDLAKKIAGDFKNGGVLALVGDLGAGKTVFAQGFAEGLGIEEKVISPTFVLMRQHKIPKTEKMFYHLDLYRLENVDIKEMGLEEIFEGQGNIVLIEWAEKIYDYLPKNTTVIKIEKISENERNIILEKIN